MEHEIPNEHQSSPAQIVAFVTGATQSLHSEPEFTPGNTSNNAADAQELHNEPGDGASIVEDLQETQELHDVETAQINPNPPIQPPEGVDLPPPAVELPRLVPRQSTFVPEPGTWWRFVDHDPGYALRVERVLDDKVTESLGVTLAVSDIDAELEVVGAIKEVVSINDFRSGFYVEASIDDVERLVRKLIVFKLGNKYVNPSDPERAPSEPIPSVSSLFESIGAELGVDKSHVQRLTESALEGVRTFVALKSFVDSSPVVSALAEILRSPMLLEAAKIIVTVPVEQVAEDTFHLLLNATLEPVVESLKKLVDERLETLQMELVARRQWENNYDVYAKETREKIELLEKRFNNIEAFDTVEATMSIDRENDATTEGVIDSRINPQTNELREQIANLFERCDNLERNRLKDQQARSRAEKARKQASAAKDADRKQAINAASRTLQERKRREAKEAESLKIAAERRHGPRLPSMAASEPKKRGRGRPPTRKAVAEVNLFDGSPIKRGRGRPRKNP